jgi:hypothetical protein
MVARTDEEVESALVGGMKLTVAERRRFYYLQSHPKLLSRRSGRTRYNPRDAQMAWRMMKYPAVWWTPKWYLPYE